MIEIVEKLQHIYQKRGPQQGSWTSSIWSYRAIMKVASNHQIYLWRKDYSSWWWYMKILTAFQGTETQWSHQAKCKFFQFFWPAWCSKNQILFFSSPFIFYAKCFFYWSERAVWRTKNLTWDDPLHIQYISTNYFPAHLVHSVSVHEGILVLWF